jgi:nicotinate phosphoribosyltransferase
MAQTILLTDLYELAMLEAYAAEGMAETAVFELFFRKLPAERGFLMAAGLAQVVEYLETMRFTVEELAWLREASGLSNSFVQSLAALRFTGDLDAMAEGTIFFPDEPVLRVTALLPQAQLIETRLLNLVHFETLIASKAARMVLAAPGKALVDFGLRRAHGAEAGVLAARAAYLAGFAATATVESGRQFGIPLAGTMAHSFIEAHDEEAVAFEHFARTRPKGLTLLIDTYDTERGARRVAELAPRLAMQGIKIDAVRLDSGDLAKHSFAVRWILDAAGLQEIGIFASGGLDEHSVLRLCRQGAPIDGFGIGTSLTTSSDAPALDCAYKLQEYAGRPRRKKSEGKATWPGRKQVYRRYHADGTIAGDTIALVDEIMEGEALLRPVLRGGKRVDGLPDLAASRRHAAQSLERLPEPLRKLEQMAIPVTITQEIGDLAARLDRVIAADTRA